MIGRILDRTVGRIVGRIIDPTIVVPIIVGPIIVGLIIVYRKVDWIAIQMTGGMIFLQFIHVIKVKLKRHKVKARRFQIEVKRCKAGIDPWILKVYT